MAADRSCTDVRKGKDYDWAFDLRTQFYDSSESEDDCPPHLPNETTDNSMLMKEFDLSSREEFVSYKPNPFTIAKVNASYRSAKKGVTEVKPSEISVTSMPKSNGGLLQSKITDGFKVQASKRLSFSNQQKKTSTRKSSSDARTIFHKANSSPKTIHDPPPEPQAELSLSQDHLRLNPHPLSSFFPSNAAHIATQVESAPNSGVNNSCHKPFVLTPSMGTGQKNRMSQLEGFLSHSSPLQEPVTAFRGRKMMLKHNSSPPRQSTFKHIGLHPAILTPAGYNSVPFSRSVEQNFILKDQQQYSPSPEDTGDDLHELDIGLLCVTI